MAKEDAKLPAFLSIDPPLCGVLHLTWGLPQCSSGAAKQLAY
jgi:hypothetical protein